MAACSRAAQTAVDQSAPTHCKSPTPQVGTGGERQACRGHFPPQDSAFLWRPPAVKGRDEGASKRDGNPSNQTTQVVHLGGRLYVKPDGKQKMGLLSSIPGSRGKRPLAMNPGEQKQSTSFHISRNDKAP